MRSFVALFYLSLASLSFTGPSYGEETWTCAINPRDVGLDIPSGPVSFTPKAVATHDSQNEPVVAKVLVNVGAHRIVQLPDGELVTRTEAESPYTDRPFVATSADDLIRRLISGPLSGFQARKTRHYVCIYNTSDDFALITSRTLESMVPGMQNHAKQLRIEAHDPEVPLVAIMFRTRQEFDAFRRMPEGVIAYYHTLSNHVVMYEESPLWRVKPELALQQSISTIAHEGAHQILHNIGVQQRLSVWPMWLSEGLAEYYAPTSFGRSLRWKGAGQVNDMRMFELELYLKGRDADAPNGQMIQHTVSAARLTSTGYASAWSLIHYLAKMDRERFQSFVRNASVLRPLEGGGEVVAPGIIPVQLQKFQDSFGSDLAKLEDRLVKHLKALPYTDPFVEWPHFVATVEVASGRRPRRDANLFHSPEMAQKWVHETIQGLPEDLRTLARPGIEQFPNRLVAERYARQFLGTAP